MSRNSGSAMPASAAGPPQNHRPQPHESLGCKWSEFPLVIPAVDSQGYFTHTGLFGYSPDMNKKIDLRKLSHHTATTCSIALEGTDQLPWFHTANAQRKKYVPKTSAAQIFESGCGVVFGFPPVAKMDKKVGTGTNFLFICEFQLGANGPYRRCEMIDLKLAADVEFTRLEFQPPAQVYTWSGGLECVPIRLDIRCWSLQGSGDLSAVASLLGGAGQQLPPATPFTANNGGSANAAGQVDHDGRGHALQTFLTPTNFCSGGSQNLAQDGNQPTTLLDHVDEDIVSGGMNVVLLDNQQSAQTANTRRTLRGYYYWDVAHLVDDSYFRKSAPRNRERDNSLSWMSLHYINWELASGVTLLHVKIESLVPGIQYRLALLRGRDQPWSENHVDGVGGTIIEQGQTLERAVSSFPGTQDAASDNFATIHVLVHVDTAHKVAQNENRVAVARKLTPTNGAADGVSIERLRGVEDCIGAALRQFVAKNEPAASLSEGPGRAFELYFEFAAVRTHQTSEQLNQHWHGAGGHWLGAFSQSYKIPRAGADDRGRASLDDLAVDDVDHMAMYFGDLPITCPATHNWPSDYAEVTESSGKSIRINDAFEISHTLHYIRLHVRDKSLLRLYLAPESGAVGLVTADLVKLASDAPDGSVTDIAPDFSPVEAVILPFGNRQRMLAAEIFAPGMYLVRVKTPFLPVGGLYTCKAVRIRLQVSPQSMVNWESAKQCDAGVGQLDGAGLLQEEINRRVVDTMTGPDDTFSSNWMDATVTLSHRTGNAAKSFMVGNHFNGIGRPVKEEPAKDTLLRVGIQSDFLMAGLVVGIWTTPGKQAKVGIPIASPQDRDDGFVELLGCESCMVQIIYVPFQNVLADKQYCAPYSLDIANVMLSAPKCNLLAPELPLGVSYTQGGGPGYLDGDFYLGGGGKDPVEAEIDVPLGSMEHGLVVAFGQADGHMVTFERALSNGGWASDGTPREQLFSFWSQSGGGRLKIRVRPEVIAVTPNCLNVNLHVFAAKFEMLPLCPWKDTRVLTSEQAGAPPTEEQERQKFEAGIMEALSQIKPLSEGTPVDVAHLKVQAEQNDGSTVNAHILRHIVRASLSINLVAGGEGSSGEELTREAFIVNSAQGVRLRFELSLDPPIIPLELVIEDQNGLEYGRAQRIRGRRLLFLENNVPEGTYYLVISRPAIAAVMRKPPDGFPDAVQSGAYCVDTTIMIVAEPGGGADGWRQELLAYPELMVVEKQGDYPIHTQMHKEMVFSVPLRVNHQGRTLKIRKPAGRQLALRVQSEPLNLNYGKLTMEDPASGEARVLSPSGYSLLSQNTDTIQLKLYYDCSPATPSAFVGECFEQPFLLTFAVASGAEEASVDQTCSGGILGAGVTLPPANYLRDLWTPEVAREMKSAEGRSAVQTPVCLRRDFVRASEDAQRLAGAATVDPVLGLTSVRAFEVQVPGPSMIKLSYWAKDLARYSVKVGLVTVEGVWMAEQRGSYMGLGLELPGPAVYTIRVAMTEPPQETALEKSSELLPGAGAQAVSLGHFLIQTVPLGDELRYDTSFEDSLPASAEASSGTTLSDVPIVDVAAARDLRPRSKCYFQAVTLLPMDFFSEMGGSIVFHGPIKTEQFPDPPLYHAEVLLTDDHDGRKKVFLQLPDGLENASPPKFFPGSSGSSTTSADYVFQLKIGGDFAENSGVTFHVQAQATGLPLAPLWSSRDSKVYANLKPKQKLWLVFHREHRQRSISACQRFHFFLALSATGVATTSTAGSGGGLSSWGAGNCPAGTRGAYLLSKNARGDEPGSSSLNRGVLPPVQGQRLLPAQALSEALYELDGKTVAPVLMRAEEREEVLLHPAHISWPELENQLISLPGTTSVRRLKIVFPPDLVARWSAEAATAANGASTSSLKPYILLKVSFSYMSGSPAFEAGHESVARWASQEPDDSTPGLDMSRVIVVELDELLRRDWFFWWEPNFPDECGLFSFQSKLLAGPISSVVFPLSKVVRANAVKTEYSVFTIGRPQYARPKPHLVENPFGNFHIITWRRIPSERTKDFHVWVDNNEVYWAQHVDLPTVTTETTIRPGEMSAAAAANLMNPDLPHADLASSNVGGGLKTFGVGGSSPDPLLAAADKPTVYDEVRQIASFVVLIVFVYMLLKVYQASTDKSSDMSLAGRLVEMATMSTSGDAGLNGSMKRRHELYQFAGEEELEHGVVGGGHDSIFPISESIRARSPSRSGYGTTGSGGRNASTAAGLLVDPLAPSSASSATGGVVPGAGAGFLSPVGGAAAGGGSDFSPGADLAAISIPAPPVPAAGGLIGAGRSSPGTPNAVGDGPRERAIQNLGAAATTPEAWAHDRLDTSNTTDVDDIFATGIDDPL
eukprot:g19103.t1